MISIVYNSKICVGLALLLLALYLETHKVNCQIPEFDLRNGTINETMFGYISNREEIVYFYQISEAMRLSAEKTSIRIEVEISERFTTDCPVMFTIRGNQGLVSWELPHVHESKKYYTAGRTLCISHSPEEESINQTILIAISSCSPIALYFKLLLMVRQDIVVGIGEKRMITATPTAPGFFRFEYDAESSGADYLFIDVDSDQATCAMVSIQAPVCPVLDQENNVQFQGYWQSMSYKAGLTIRTSQYPNGFSIVFVILSDDERCEEHTGISNRGEVGGSFSFPFEGLTPRTKNFTFVVHEAIGRSGYVAPTLVPLIFIFGLIAITLMISIGFQHIKRDMIMDEGLEDLGDITQTDAPNGVYRTRFQSSLNISTLERNNCEKLLAQSKRYYWSLIIVAIFYCVPVFQLIINYLKVVYRTGEQDICYYNFYCARPLGYVMDFNHIYSNIGYVILGAAFIAFVKIRQKSFHIGTAEEYEERSRKKIRKFFPLLNSNLEFGVLQHFGLFYALGLALILEGLLSGAYHICPNQSNFQFDTSFMYAIAFLGIVKIYQFRHPVYISADITFISLAFVASSAVLGLLFNNLAFKISFSVIHFGAMMFLLIYLFYFGYITDADGNVVTNVLGVYDGILAQQWRGTDFNMPHWSRLVLPVLTIFFNTVVIVMIWTVMSDSNFATQILAIFVVNLFVYMTYYIIMKWIHNEYKMKLWIQPFIFLALSGVLWIISLYYFQNALSSWELSPAESKTQNADCAVFDFYDNHDLWHFLSAGALFCSFMLLLTIDDDLVTKRHDKIPVF